MVIDYNQPWHRLTKIDTSIKVTADGFDTTEFLKKSKNPNAPGDIWSFYGADMTKVLNHQWLEFVSDTIMPVGSFLMFYRSPYFVLPEAHTDIFYHSQESNIFGINIVISPDDDSVMTWYNVPNETGKLAVTSADTKYLYWPLDEVKDHEVSRVTIGNQLTLVKTGLAHNVIVNNSPRWSVSLRFTSIESIHNWTTCVDYFSKYF